MHFVLSCLLSGSVDASGPVSLRRPGHQRERHADVPGDGGGRHHRGVPAADGRPLGGGAEAAAAAG